MSDHELARVLVVDDEPQLRQLLADALRSDAVEVRTAGSGAEAVDLAANSCPDFLVTDLYLGDCNGLDVIDRLRDVAGDIPAVVITGRPDPATLSEASRRRPVELMNKPLDIDRLRGTIHKELNRKAALRAQRTRQRRLRKLARGINLERKAIQRQLDTACADLSAAYRTLSGQLSLQKVVLDYQRELLGLPNDDDVFASLFRLFVRRSGALFGVAMVCNENAELKIAGRFGVPEPDSSRFCQLLARPMVGITLSNPRCSLMDAAEQGGLFDPAIRRYLPGVSVLSIPLMPSPGEMIGLVILYRKGEQPFMDSDLALAEAVAPAVAVSVRRND